ncbi:MAG: sulfite exporter TauE/SafE family protein, partial [Bacteroidota bacterium]|nr:sulfite exporter TauE/SafE family protein [Bacteroidota bacterium]
SARWLIIFAVLGIPLGLFMLVYGNESFIKLGLGVIIILYSVYSIRSKTNFKLEKDDKKWLFVCGFLSGIFGGAYGLSGPPLVVYGKMRSWTAKHFRATLQAYFLPVSTIGMLGYWYKGLLNATVIYYFSISIPVIIPAIFLGRYLNHRLKEGTFLNYIYIGLICIGLLLLVQSLI